MSKVKDDPKRSGAGMKVAAKSTRSQPAAPPSAPKSGDVVAIGIRMSKSQHKDLKAIAYFTEVTLNSLLIEGVERVIADRKAKGVRFD